MRSYVIDDISVEDCQNLAKHLASLELQTSLADVFWLTVPQELLNAEQLAHAQTCGPHVMALEIEENHELIRMELLVRAQNALHCSCVGYAPPPLIEHMIKKLNGILTSLAIDY